MQSIPRIYNLGSGSRQPLRELILDVVSQLNLKVDLRFGARDYARFEPRFLVANASRANAELSWQPRKNLAYSVWELARSEFPSLQLTQPEKWIYAPQ